MSSNVSVHVCNKLFGIAGCIAVHEWDFNRSSPFRSINSLWSRSVAHSEGERGLFVSQSCLVDWRDPSLQAEVLKESEALHVTPERGTIDAHGNDLRSTRPRDNGGTLSQGSPQKGRLYLRKVRIRYLVCRGQSGRWHLPHIFSAFLFPR